MQFCLSVADTRIAVSCNEPLAMRVATAATAFLVDCAAPDVVVRVETGDLSPRSDRSRFEGGEEIFDSGGLWRLRRDDDALVFRFVSPACGPVPYKAARIRSDFTSGDVCLHRPYFETAAEVYPLEYPLDELVLTSYLAQGRGAEIHACGVIDPAGAGYLFAGASGAGKTTMARLWACDPYATVLSDDRVVLRPAGGRVWMYGTPWHGDAQLAAPAAVPLTRIFFLRHARSHRLAPVGGALAAAELFSCAFVPFYSDAALASTLDLLSAITAAIPCDDFWFAPDPGAIEFVRRQGR